MLALLRQSLALRVAIAALLSGAPRLACALAPEPEHRCECAAHGPEHRCTCPVCAMKARVARHRELRALPPCHREAALRAAAEEDRPLPGPCLGPSCGRGDPRATVTPGQDTFTLAKGPRLALSDSPPPPDPRPTLARERPAAPEPPPPRA